MKILLTGANGYIGLRLLPVLLDQGHEVTCLVRDERRFPHRQFEGLLEGDASLRVIEGDLLDPDSLSGIPADIEIAYYLVHSMGSGKQNFLDLEARSARNFLAALDRSQARQIIYLSGIVNHPKEDLPLTSPRDSTSRKSSTRVPFPSPFSGPPSSSEPAAPPSKSSATSSRSYPS